MTTLIVIAILIAVWFFAPRPRLDPTRPATRIPPDLELSALQDWLENSEFEVPGIIDGAEACIRWADGPSKRPLCVLYVHGFSASRQETAPVTDHVAEKLGANVVYARLAGHGVDQNIMEASTEDWLQSVVDAWEAASRIGEKVIIIAVSTGAPLSVWLTQQPGVKEQLHSLIFMSPNFKIRNPFGFILTWPWATKWVPLLLGRERYWEPESEAAAKYWSHRYSTLAVIEMQKIVNWVAATKLDDYQIPLATIYVDGDPTIDHAAAITFHQRWQAASENLIEVDMGGAEPMHVFAGDITAPDRVDWCVEVCHDFLTKKQQP